MIEDHLGNLMRKFGFVSGIANISNISNQIDVEDDKNSDRLNLDTAVEIRHGEYEVAKDGTIIVDGFRTFIYICNPSNYFGRISIDDISSLPKYHFTECSTIVNMAKIGRADRYVRPIIPDGNFRLLLVNNNKEEMFDTQLYPCGNCLKELFPETPFSKRSAFTIEQFFSKFPKKCADEFIASRKSVLTANHNNYSKGFKKLSEKLRSKKECHSCWGKFAPRDLDTHHLDGDASNNSTLNLKVLCIDCHVNEPNHSHYKSLLKKNGRLEAFYSKYPDKKFIQ